MSKCTILLLEAGIVALDDQDNVIRSYSFDTHMAKTYRAIKSGTQVDQLQDVLEFLRLEGFDAVVSNDEGLANILSKNDISVTLMERDKQTELQEQKLNLMVKVNFAKNEFEALGLLRKFAVDLSSLKVGEISAKRDYHIIQSINAMDEVDKIINLMGSRLREWYGLHFPELDGMIQNLITYCDTVLAGSRDSIDKGSLKETGMPEDKAEEIVYAAQVSKGGAVTAENVEAIKNLAGVIKNLNSVRGSLTAHLEREMDSVAPNVKEILGATIGARMIAKTGGLERLSYMAASTIQVIGAEKALFRALKTGSRPPKHGIIFQHPLIHSAPKWQRGKIARAIAAKVAIAARIDVHKGSKDSTLTGKLDERIEEIRQKYKEPVEREEHVERPSPMYEQRRKRGRGNKRFRDKRRKNFAKRRR
ncbi:MAG: NOP5/NOP56 family protein [Nitrososphaerales archaeon]